MWRGQMRCKNVWSPACARRPRPHQPQSFNTPCRGKLRTRCPFPVQTAGSFPSVFISLTSKLCRELLGLLSCPGTLWSSPGCGICGRERIRAPANGLSSFGIVSFSFFVLSSCVAILICNNPCYGIADDYNLFAAMFWKGVRALPVLSLFYRSHPSIHLL